MGGDDIASLLRIHWKLETWRKCTYHVFRFQLRGILNHPLGSPGNQVKNAVGVRSFNLPECEFMHMGSVTAFKGSLLERLNYFHHRTDRETEGQNGTHPEGQLPKESRGTAGVKQVRSSTPSPVHLSPCNFPRAGSKGDFDGFVCQQQARAPVSSSFGFGDRAVSTPPFSILSSKGDTF